MNGSPQRAIVSQRREEIEGSARSGQETQATALRAPLSLRVPVRRARFPFLSLAACALFGLTAVTVGAQDAPKADSQAQPAAQPKTPAQTAQAQPPPPPPVPQPAPAAPAAPAPGTVSISGLVDVYYGVNARAPSAPGGGPFATILTPSGEHIGIDNVGRSFDINDREPSFSLGEVNITRTPGHGFPLGITATLTVGDTARLVHATEPGGTSSWQTIQQLYLTYTPHLLGRDIPIDFGAFVTPFGYEVIESSSNDNYSRGLLFQFAVPLYHAGLRATVPINNQLSLLAGVVNGWNDIADDNNAKSVLGQLTWKPNAKLTGIAGWMGGSEGTGAYGSAIPHNQGNITTNLFDGQVIYQLTDKLKLAAWGDYGQGAGDVTGVHVSGYWLGYAGFARYQFTNHFAVAARLEQFEDVPGVGGIGLRTGLATYQKLREATLTLEYTSFRGHLVSRLEYRHDHATVPFFGASGGAVVPDQDTIYLGEVYKF